MVSRRRRRLLVVAALIAAPVVVADAVLVRVMLAREAAIEDEGMSPAAGHALIAARVASIVVGEATFGYFAWALVVGSARGLRRRRAIREAARRPPAT